MFNRLRRLVSSFGSLPKVESKTDKHMQNLVPGLTPIDDTHPEDVFVVGYPKSGNTWMQNLIAGVVYGLDPEYLPFTLVDDLVPDVHARHYYRRFGTPMYFKSHNLPRPQYRRVIYLLRDGRHVMVSYFHFLTALNRPAQIDFADIVRTGTNLYPGKWHEHIIAWQQNPHHAQIMTLKYEDLLNDPVAHLKSVCEFLSIGRPISHVELVVEKASFTSMRAKERRFE